MSADLKMNGLMSRQSILLMEDSLVFLEHTEFKDRIHKIQYEDIESILVWKGLPWIKMSMTVLLIGGPGAIFLWEYFSSQNSGSINGALAFLGFMIILLSIFYIRKVTHVKINHGAGSLDLKLEVFPWKVRGFVEKVRAQIEVTQNTLRKQRDAETAQKINPDS